MQKLHSFYPLIDILKFIFIETFQPWINHKIDKIDFDKTYARNIQQTGDQN